MGYNFSPFTQSIVNTSPVSPLTGQQVAPTVNINSPFFDAAAYAALYGRGGGYQAPTTTPIASNIASAYGLKDVGSGMYYYPTADKYFSGDKFYTKSGTEYQPYESDVIGFNRASDTGIYSPSQAYMYGLTRPTYTPLQQSSVYTPASSSVYKSGQSLLSPTTSTGYGAGRYLGSNGLLSLNFSAPQTATTGQ